MMKLPTPHITFIKKGAAPAVLSKRSPYLKSADFFTKCPQRWRPHLFIAWMLLISSLPSAQGQGSKSGFEKIAFTSPQDWVAYSSDATKVAIVHTQSLPEHPAIGISLNIYRVDSSLQPAQLLFRDKRETQFITEFQWVGNHLFYLTIKGVEKTKLPPLEWLGQIGAHDGWEGVSHHLGVEVWAGDPRIDLDFSSIQSASPGNIFSSSGSDVLLVFDSLHDKLKHWNEKNKSFDDAFFSERALRSYTATTGNLISNIKLPLRVPANRWWGGRGSLVPLFLSKGDKQLVALVSNNTSWKTNADPNRPAVIAIDLLNGKINAVTPDSWLNGLHLSKSSDPQYFAWGNPAPTDGYQQVVCQLPLGEATSELAFRFAFFKLTGERTREVLIFNRDLKQAGVPNGLLLTWTLDGTKVLIQDNDIWLMDWRKRAGHRIAQGVKIEDIIGWVDKRHLLVRAQVNRQGGGALTSSTRRFLTGDRTWALLTLPQTSANPTG